jgi:transcriptional regulator with XRE-family HTH domain
MEQTQPSRLSDADRRAAVRAAGKWLADRMRDRGYAMPPHGRGGVRRLAEHVGAAPSVISLLLRGETLNPSPDTLRNIASTLGLPFTELLVRFAVLTPDDLRHIAGNPPVGSPPITIETAAAGLNIDTDDPVGMGMFEGAVNAVRDLQNRPTERAE